MKKRTDFEYVLKRRQLNPEDFSSYLSYEITLDKLRMARTKRMGSSKPKEMISLLSSIQASFIRHIVYIYERAVRRFPSHTSFWSDFIAYLQERKSTAILNTVFGRALSLFPKQEDFWLKAAVHELELNNNTHAARVILQRALRVNGNSHKLWLRYFELELWNCAKLIEREKLLALKRGSEEEDGVDAEATLTGAPLVVFKYALGSLSSMDDILNIYLSCEGISSVLSIAMEKELKRQHRTSTVMWAQLLVTHTDRALYGYAAGVTYKNSSSLASIHSKAVSLAPVVTSCSVAMAECQTLLFEAQKSCCSGGGGRRSIVDAEGDTDVAAAAAPLTISFVMFAAKAIHTTLLKVSAYIGGSLESEQVLAEVLQGIEDGGELATELFKFSQTLVRLQQLLASYLNVIKGSEQNRESIVLQGVVSWVNHRVLLLAHATGIDLGGNITSNSDISNSKRRTKKRKGSDLEEITETTTTTTSAAFAGAEWESPFATSIHDSIHTSTSWLTLMSNSLVRYSSRSSKSDAQLLADMDAYCFVMNDALDVATRLYAASAEEEEMAVLATGSSTGRDSLETLRLLGSSLVQVCPALLRCETSLEHRRRYSTTTVNKVNGNAAAAVAISTAVGAGAGAESTVCLASVHCGDLIKHAIDTCTEIFDLIPLAEQMLKAIIADAATDCIDKGYWCARYMEFLVHTSAFEPQSVDNRCNSNTSSVLDRLRLGYAFVVQSRRSTPHAFTRSDMEQFFETVLQIEHITAYPLVQHNIAPMAAGGGRAVPNVSSSSSSLRSVLSPLLDVAEEAVLTCPQREDFWDALESAQADSGDVAAAGRTKWQRKRQQQMQISAAASI